MTREEILKIAKPILFNTDMVKVVLEDKMGLAEILDEMIDCSNYRIQLSTNEEWCRAGVEPPICSENCPFREPCKDEWEREERIYPDEA